MRSSIVAKISPSRCACSGRPEIVRAECTSEVIGASELLSSWLMTRIVFFQTSTSWRTSSRVSGFTM